MRKRVVQVSREVQQEEQYIHLNFYELKTCPPSGHKTTHFQYDLKCLLWELIEVLVTRMSALQPAVRMKHPRWL